MRNLCNLGGFMESIIKKQLYESAEIKKIVAENFSDKIASAVKMIIECYRKGGKTVFFGNGGSAADSQHLAAEFVGRFKLERQALPSLALHTNSSTITALGNDYDYSIVFVRQIEALLSEKDVAIGLSTSGNSLNVIKAIKKAKEIGAQTIGLAGKDGGKLATVSDISIIIPSDDTARIQEAHITIGHIIADLVEKNLFGQKFPKQT